MNLRRCPNRSCLTAIAGLVASVALMYAQQANPGGEPAKATGSEKPAPKAIAESTIPGVDPKAYKLGPEDIISVRVWKEPELSGTFAVRPDGKITLPLHGDLMVDAISLDGLRDAVVEAYSKFINKPEVAIQLLRVGSKKYYLVGEVVRSGEFPMAVPITVMEAINKSGGFREFANKKKIIIIRGAKRIKFNYDEVLKGKKVEQNIMLEAGDQIVVP
jgi:polysaccharide export outer membrane protein